MSDARCTRLAIALGFFSLIYSCSSDPEASKGAPTVGCVPGQSVSCTSPVACPAGTLALAQCGPAGSLGPCTCGAPPAPAAGSGGTTAVGGPAPAGTGVAVAGSASLPTAGSAAGAAGTGGGVSGTGGVPGLPTAAKAGAWRMMGYDSNNRYHNPSETILSVGNAAMLKEKWRFTVAGFPPGSPVVAEGKVFVMATGGTYGISLTDGSKLWERTDIAGTASCAYEDGFVYAHDVGANLWKLNASDGKTVWGPVSTNEVADCDGTSSPIVGANIVSVGHACGPIEMNSTDHTEARGGVRAFDTASGKPAWTYFTVPMTGENGAMVWSSVAIDVEARMLFAATGNNYSVQGENSDSVHAIDVMSGMRMWKTQIRTDDTWSFLRAPGGPDSDFGANPILAEVDGKLIVAAGDKGAAFHAFDRMTGTILWQREDLSSSWDATHGGMLMNGAFDGTYFYAVSNQPPNAAVLHALDPRKMGADAWPAKTLQKITWGAPAIANGVLAVPSDDDLLIMNAMTGELLATLQTGGTIGGGSPALVDGHVVVGSGLSYYLDTAAKNNNQVICYAVPGATVPEGGPGPTTPTTPTAPTFVPGSATWSAIYQEIIVNTGCNGGSTCHASTAGGNLVMQNKNDSYAALVGVPAAGTAMIAGMASCVATGLTRVVASSPDTSLLVNKIEAATPMCGTRMPPGGALTAAQQKQVRDWIVAGAKND